MSTTASPPVLFAPRIVLTFVLVALVTLAVPARAGVFDDDEARKRIDTLKVRVDDLERSLVQRLDVLESKNAALVDLFKDVEQIKSDIAKLRGQYEVLTYELEQTQKRQRDLYLDLDSRLRKLEGGPGNAGSPDASASGAPGADAGASPAGGATGVAPGVTPGVANTPPGAAGAPTNAGDPQAEQRAYDAALDQFKSGNYPAAVQSFQTFARAYPKSPLAASAMYWTGNAQYAQRDFRTAIATQRQLIATYPDSQKVPDALLNIASCQSEMGDTAAARRTLDDIIAKYPTSEAATKARQRISPR